MDPAIAVADLRKIFRTKIKAPGLRGSITSLLSPQYRETPAVNGISFTIPKGQLVGFIGPNGAGKSTTLKILTGILHPSGGNVEVLGMVPWRERKKLAYKIGTVFGQRSQLWMHLPCRDSFELFAAIYGLSKREYHERVQKLAKEFEIEDLLDVPVRKLSLGQRMRAELVAALLHKPHVLYLDEPSIGLDILAKKRLREHIRRINKEEGVTIIFTSHDMDDIEEVCERVIVINHGKIVQDSTVEEMRKQYLQKKIITVYHEPQMKKFRGKGIVLTHAGEFQSKFEVDKTKTRVRDALAALTKHYTVEDIEISDPPIEEIIEDIFARQ